MDSTPRHLRTLLVAAAAIATAAAGGALILSRGDSAPSTTVVRPAARPLELVKGDDESSVAISEMLFVSSPTVLIADADDPAAQDTAIDTASTLRVPVLIDGPTVSREVARLGAETILTVGRTTRLPDATALPADPARAATAIEKLGEDLGRGRQGQLDTVVVLRTLDDHAAAIANATSAGATVVESPSGDPRRDEEAASVLRERETSPVVAVDPPRDFGYTLDVVRGDVQQPTGGSFALPGKHYVALYGHPGAPTLGVLGEQGVAASVKRVEQLTDQYRDLSDSAFVPTFEIIATVAAGSAGKDGNYSNEVAISTLEPLVDAAEKAGIYVVLDLQPGRTDFLTQAKQYRSLLARPHVGLALDPEWRLTKKQKPLQQIGSVGIEEVNQVGDWLAELTRTESLPQKVFVLHQFTSSMLKDRDRLDTSHAELATVIHVDGSGPPGAKQGTWNVLHRQTPKGLTGWGWKNFYDEDAPMMTPQQTWRDVDPVPDLITYQ